MDGFRALMGLVGTAIDGAGVQVVVTGVLIAAFRFVFRKGEATYRTFRQDLGRASRPGAIVYLSHDHSQGDRWTSP